MIIHKAIPILDKSRYIGFGSSNLETKCGLNIGSANISISDGICSYYNGYNKESLLVSKNNKDVTCEKCRERKLVKTEDYGEPKGITFKSTYDDGTVCIGYSGYSGI